MLLKHIDRMNGPRPALNFLQPPNATTTTAIKLKACHCQKKRKEETEESRHPCPVFSHPDVKRLPKSFHDAFHPPPAGFISPSPTLSIRTLVCSPVIKSSSSGSSTGLSSSSSSSSSETSLPHCPLRGRSPTKYTRTSGTSASSAVRSSSAGENAMQS